MMPLFTFKCSDCGEVKERFVRDETTTFECKCGSTVFERQLGAATQGKVWKGAADHLENVIQPEVDRIQEQVSRGDDRAFLDLVGDE